MIKETQCDAFAGRLADLLERDADESVRAALEAHALACGDCGALLADMRKLRIDASSLPALAPTRDLWDGISQRIDAPVIPLHAGVVEPGAGIQPWRRWLPLSAAAALLIAATSISTYVLTIRFRGADSATAVATRPPTVGDTGRITPESAKAAPTVVATATDGAKSALPTSRQPEQAASGTTTGPGVRLASAKPSAEQVYTTEIARLHTIVERRRGQLDPVTIGVIERNLKVIDDAIAQCKLALTKDPASRFLMESLNNALENKVQLLRTATMLPARS